MSNGNPVELFELQKIVDNPMFEGFGLETSPSVLGNATLRDDMSPGPGASKNRNWKPRFLADKWRAPKVAGRVQPFQDFPCIGMVLPAFSRRACDSLRDFLEPNGELLPLDTGGNGEYYFYNITTVVDALDLKRSKCDFWCDPPTTAMEIEYFAFHKEKLAGGTIFRIPELPVMTIVSDEFVKRVFEHGLNGFDFIKIWPFPKGVIYRLENKKKKKITDRQKQKLKQHTFVISIRLTGKKPNAAEKKRIKKLEDDLDAQLAVSSLDAPYFGSYEGHDIVSADYRLFLSCPDVDILERKLSPWIKTVLSDADVRILKRYGEMHDEDAEEKWVTL